MNTFARGALAVSLWCIAAAVAAAPLQIRSLTMKPPATVKELPAYAGGWADGSIKMPFVVSEPPTVAARINTSLFLGLLGMAAPAKPGESFAPLAEQLPEGTSSQEFQLVRNDARVLAITFSTEGCGAYCENYDTTFNFDARNGRALALDDLFTQPAFATVAQRIGKERERLYADQLKTLKKELAAQKRAHAKADDIEDTQQRIELNQGCLEQERGKPHLTDSLRYVGFSLEGDGVAFSTGRCSNHASRALDDVAEITVTLTPAELRPLLTPYGRALVLNQGDVPPPASPFGQVLHGKIGGAAITMMLARLEADGSLSGRYYYDKYGRMIPLSGKRNGNTLALTEDVDGNKAELSLTVRGNAVTGQWQGNGKTVPVALDW